jgi:hypothetical protein
VANPARRRSVRRRYAPRPPSRRRRLLSSAARGTAAPLVAAVRAITLTGMPTATAAFPERMRNSSGKACSRNCRPAPTKARASAASGQILAETVSRRLGRIVGQGLDGQARRIDDLEQHLPASTTWPATTWAALTTPEAGAVRGSALSMLAPMAAALASGGQFDARRLDLLARDGAFQLLIAIQSALGDRHLGRQLGQQGPLVAAFDGPWSAAARPAPRPLMTFCPRVGMPRGPGSTRPAWVAWTRPPALGSAITRPLNSSVAARSAMATGWVRRPSCRCAGLGTNRPPSARRCAVAERQVHRGQGHGK